MNIFAEMIHAVYDFKSYIKFKENRPWKVFFYGLILSAVCVLVTTVLPVASVMGFAGNAGEVIGDVLPDFSLSDVQFQKVLRKLLHFQNISPHLPYPESSEA